MLILVWYLLVVITALLLLALGVIAVMTLRRRYPAIIAIALIWLFALGMALQPLLSKRDLRFLGYGFDYIASPGSAGLIGKLILYVVLGLAALEWFQRLMRLKTVRPTPANLLWFAFVGYFVAAYVLSSMLGSKPEVQHFLAYPLLVFGAMYFSGSGHPDLLLRQAKNALGAVLGASAIVGLISPEMVVQTGYRGSIPLFSFRMWGLAAHANAFGALVLAFLVLNYAVPYRHTLAKYVAWVLGVVLLVMVQSKATWGAGLVILSLLLFTRVSQEMRGPSASHGGVGSRRDMGVSGFAATFLAGSAMLMLVLSALAWSSGLLPVRAGWFDGWDTKAIVTLTGRDVIWDAAVAEWLRNPLFGYGPTIWDDDFRKMVGMPFAFHGHSQLFQTLSSAGLVGLTGLAVYVGMVIWTSFRAPVEFRRVVVPLTTLLLVRAFAEPSFEIKSMFDSNQFLHLILFATLVSVYRAREPIIGGNRSTLAA